MGIELYTKGLVKKDGIWYAEKKAAVSYPGDGNDICFQIEDKSFWFRHRNNCIIALVKKFRPGGLFFDVGGGNGFVAKGLEEAGIETVLVEPGETGCFNAKKRKLSNIICSTIEDAGFEKASLPAIGVFDVVEHFQDDVALLKEMHDYLVKDGLLFITVPAYKVLWSNEDTDAGHYNRYTLKSLSKKLSAAGYTIEYATYIFSILPLPVLLFRTIPGKIGLNKAPGDVSKNSSDHKKENPVLTNIWAWELNRVKANKSIPFGGSCLIVAKKK